MANVPRLEPRKVPARRKLEEIPRRSAVVETEGKGLAYRYGFDKKELAAAGHQRLTKDEA